MNKEILRLAIPNILSNISIPLLSTVDTALMGRLSEAHLGAVGLGAMIFNFVYWNLGFLRMGTTGLTAQSFGAGDKPEIIHTLIRALMIGLIMAVVILIFTTPLFKACVYLLQVSEDQVGFLWEYFRIRIWAAPASLALYALLGWFFGMQNALYPLILTIIINSCNIALSYYLVWHLDWEIKGVAMGTLVAQYLGLIIGVILFFFKYKSLTSWISKSSIIAWNRLHRFMMINRDIFIRTVCLTGAFAIFYSQSSAMGATILASNIILLQFVNWMSYGIDGFAFASESLIGKYNGARDESSQLRAIKLSFIWGGALALLFALSYWAFGQKLLYVFTDNQALIEPTGAYLIWIILFPILSFACYIWDGIFIGLTASKAMRNTMIFSFVSFLIILFLIRDEHSNHLLWLALLLFMLIRGLAQSYIYWRNRLELR